MSKDNCFWADNPPQQWIYLYEEPHQIHRWCVMVGGSKRAMFKDKLDAMELMLSLIQTFEDHT